MIIAKGQGNFEGLMQHKDPRIWYLLMVKCQVIGDMLGARKGDLVVFNDGRTDRPPLDQSDMQHQSPGT